jgi:hypothetical protein
LKFLTDHYPGFLVMQLESARSKNGEEISENFWKNIHRKFFEKWPTLVVPPDVLATFSGNVAEAEAGMKKYKEGVITLSIDDRNSKLTVHSENIHVVL